MDRWAIDIDRADITRAAIVRDESGDLQSGEIEVAVALFAMTANNVTYAALGEPMGVLGPDAGYWDFFGDREAPGRLPVWGFATVTRTRCGAIAEGDEFYGYWPMASHARLLPDRAGAVGFVDAMPRRLPLPAFYNRYQRVAALDGFRPEDRDLWPLFRPLQMTGWLLADQLEEAGDHGAARVLVSAASSKTALGMAHAWRARMGAAELVGLTSPANVAHLERLGLYDRIVGYDAIPTLDDRAAVLVDIAGNPAVIAALGDRLTRVVTVGKAHWDAGAGFGGKGAGPTRETFFAPGRIARRSAEWGGDALRARVGAGWESFLDGLRDAVRIDRRHGAQGALDAYREAVAGALDPRAGLLVANP